MNNYCGGLLGVVGAELWVDWVGVRIWVRMA